MRLTGRQWSWVLLGCVIGLYAIAVAPIYFVWSFTPDEAWFYSDAIALAKQAAGHGLISQHPHLGYGAFFWWFYASLVDAMPALSALWTARTIVYLLTVSIPVALWVGGANRPMNAWLAVLLWISMPAAWWIGKLNSPEIPSLALFVWAAVLVARGGRYFPFGWLLFGMAAGLKLTALGALPIVTGLSLAALKSGKPADWLRHGLVAGLAALAGYLVMNPLAMLGPVDFWRELLAAGSPTDFSASALKRVLWDESWTWDALPAGGIFAQGMYFPSFCLAGLAIAIAAVRGRDSRYLLAAFVLTIALAAPIYFREKFLLWYAFPPLLGVAFLAGRVETARPATLLLASAFCLQFVAGVPLIARSYQLKLWHAADLREITTTSNFVASQLERWGDVRLAIDLSEVGTGLLPPDQMKIPARGIRYLREFDASRVISSGLAKLGPTEGTLVIVIGNRLASIVPGYDLSAKLRDPDWRGRYVLLEEIQSKNLRLYRFRYQPGARAGAPAA